MIPGKPRSGDWTHSFLSIRARLCIPDWADREHYVRTGELRVKDPAPVGGPDGANLPGNENSGGGEKPNETTTGGPGKGLAGGGGEEGQGDKGIERQG